MNILMSMFIAVGVVILMVGQDEQAKGVGMIPALCALAYYTEDCSRCEFRVNIKDPVTGSIDFQAYNWKMNFTESVRWGRLIPEFEPFECCDTSESLNCCNMFDHLQSAVCDNFALEGIEPTRINLPPTFVPRYSPLDSSKQCPASNGWDCYYFLDEEDEGLADGEIKPYHLYTGTVPDGFGYICCGALMIIAASLVILGKCIHTVRANERTYKIITVKKRRRDLEVLVDYLAHVADDQYDTQEDLPTLAEMTQGLIPSLKQKAARPHSAPVQKKHDQDLAHKIGMGKHRGLKIYDERATHTTTVGRVYGTHLPRFVDPAHIVRNKAMSRPARAFKTLGINNFRVEERKFCRPVSAPTGQTVYWTGGAMNKTILQAMKVHESCYDTVPVDWTHPRDTAPVHKSVQVWGGVRKANTRENWGFAPLPEPEKPKPINSNLLQTKPSQIGIDIEEEKLPWQVMDQFPPGF